MATERDTRERILDAAERLFATKGFSATSVREILHDAAVSSPMLYYYFGSKQDLMSTLAQERFHRFRDQARLEIADATTVEQVFMTFVKVIFASVRDNPVSSRFLLRITQSTSRMLPGDELGNMKTGHVRFLLEQSLRVRPEVDPDRRLYAVLTLHSLAMGFIMMFLSGMIDRLDDPLAEVIGKRMAHILDDDLPMLPLAVNWNPIEWRAEP